MNQIVLHNYSRWSNSSVLMEVGFFLEEQLQILLSQGCPAEGVKASHTEPLLGGMSITRLSDASGKPLDISFFSTEDDCRQCVLSTPRHLKIRSRLPYTHKYALHAVAVMLARYPERLAESLCCTSGRCFKLTAPVNGYRAYIQIDTAVVHCMTVDLFPYKQDYAGKETLVEVTKDAATLQVKETPAAPLPLPDIIPAPLLAVGDLVMGSMVRENGSRHNVLCAQVKGVVKKIIGGYHYVCAEFDLNAWIADTKYKGIMDESDVMVQYDKEKLRVIHEKMELLDNYATSLFGEYPFNRQRPVIAPSFEMEILMPVKKNFLKPNGSEDDVYIAAAILQENGQDATTKEKQCAK